MDKKLVSTHELVPLIQDILSQGNKVRFTVSGSSMLPWIVDNRDQVLVEGVRNKVIKKGDIILFECKEGEYILHRIIKIRNNQCLTIGDSCLISDGWITISDIIGIVKVIYRKDKVIHCDSLAWITVFTIWRWMKPIRKLLLRIYFLLIRWKNKYRSPQSIRSKYE